MPFKGQYAVDRSAIIAKQNALNLRRARRAGSQDTAADISDGVIATAAAWDVHHGPGPAERQTLAHDPKLDR